MQPTDLIGVAEVPNATDLNTPTSPGTDEREETTDDKVLTTSNDIGLNYVLPMVTTLLGVAMVTVALLIAAVYLRKLKKRNQRVGVATHRSSTSHTEYVGVIIMCTHMYALYSNIHYTYLHHKSLLDKYRFFSF